MTHSLSPAITPKDNHSDLETLLFHLQKKPNADFLPLANNPERFIDFIYFLRRKTDATALKEEMAEKFDITLRQVNFYVKAGKEIFGIFYSPRPNFIALTALGKQLADSRKAEVEQFIVAIMKKVPLVQSFLHKDVSIAKEQIISEIEENEAWVKSYSASSIERRADTIRSWVDHIQKLGKPLAERDIIRFVKENSDILSTVMSRQIA